MGTNWVRTDGIPFTADWAPQKRLKESSHNLLISIEDAIWAHRNKKAFFLDARPQEPYEKGHIAGAINLPLHEIDQHLNRFFKKVNTTETLLITYCDGDTCTLSEELAKILQEMGYQNVHVLLNGWSVWQENGYPVETGNQE